MTSKSYFKERNINEISRLHQSEVYTQRGLVKKILDLDPSEEGIVLKTRLTPGRFYINAESSRDASRRCYKHGDLILLSMPRTQADAFKTVETPSAVMSRDFSRLSSLREEQINFVGYSFRPVQGRDRRKRVIPFVWLPEAVRLFGYSENLAGHIGVKPFADAKRVAKEGASVVCSVPSRTKKKARYNTKLEHVPVLGNHEKLGIILSLKSKFEIEPEHSTWNIRYTTGEYRESSDIFTFYPQDIAAYIAIVASYWKQHNMVPREMNPFALPSRLEAEFYNKLCNNLLVFDPSLSSKTKLRKLHLDEKCILLARSIKVIGYYKSMFWCPERDGKLKDYDWSIHQSHRLHEL
jgi:hypothetical protein